MFSLKNFIKNCSTEWLPIFEHNRKQFTIKAKDYVFAEGEKVNGVYFIEKGFVKVLSKQGEKEQKIVRIAGDGMFLGHRGLNAEFYPVSAIALNEVKLCFIPNDIFLKLIKANPELSIQLIQFLTNELRETEERIKNLLIHDPKRKIANILLKSIDVFGFKKDSPQTIAYSISRSELADMAGTTYETVIRTLSTFEKNKVILLIGKEYEIVNLKKLKSIALGKISI